MLKSLWGTCHISNDTDVLRLQICLGRNAGGCAQRNKRASAGARRRRGMVASEALSLESIVSFYLFTF
jgi:hypothetical protein